MNSLMRRKLLVVLGSSVMAGTTLLVMRPRRTRQGVTVGAGEDPLLPEARQWVDRLRSRGTATLVYPVSKLQRELRTGYTRTCALADCLAQHGEWTIAYDDNGTRYARIHRMA